MKKRRWCIGWPMSLFMGLLAIVVVSALLTLPSMLFPYIVAPSYRWFCHFVLTPICFVVFVSSMMCTVYRAHRDSSAKVKSMPGGWLGWLKAVIFCTVASFAFGWMFVLVVPAIPSKIFAQTKVDIPVMIDHLDGLRLNYDYWTWIYFYKNGRTDRFMWTRANSLLSTLKHGDCIVLHARKWPLGAYVDSISRSNACQGAGRVDKGITISPSVVK